MSVVAPPGVLLQGVLFGTGTGLAAVGLVLTYRTSRVVNFAQGAIGGVGAEVGISLYSGHHVPWGLAIVCAVLAGALIGWVIERGMIHRFAQSPRLTVMVVTIGLAQLFGGMEGLLPGWIGGPGIVPGFATGLSTTSFTVGPVVVTGDDLLLAGVAVAAIGALSWFLYRTELGIAMRGIADNTDRARLLGLPAARISGVTWAAAMGLATLATLLSAPGQGLPISLIAGPSLLLPALAAAVIVGLDRIYAAFVAGVLLGVLDQVVRWHVATQNVSDLVLLIVILVVLAARKRDSAVGTATPVAGMWAPRWRRVGADVRARGAAGFVDRRAARQDAAWRRFEELRRSRARWVVLGAVVVILPLLPLVLSASTVNLASGTIVFALVGVSLVVLTGWGGAVSLGQFAIAGIGGLLAANMLTRWHADLLLSLLVGAVAGGLTALLIGVPSLRVRGLYLAVTTMAFSVVVDSYLLNPANFRTLLPNSVDRPILFRRFDLESEKTLYEFCLVCLTLVLLLVVNLRRGRTGRVLLACRDNPAAAGVAGLSLRRSTLVAFVISGLIAGLAGGLNVVILSGIGYHSFDPSRSFLVLTVVAIAGAESLTGALVGAAFAEVGLYLVPQSKLLVYVGLVVLGVSALRTIVEGERTRRATRLRERRDRLTPPPADRPLVDCVGLNASYGPQQVLFGVDLAVRKGELLALLGTNGAGKSTVLRCLTGLLPADSGALQVAGLSGREIAPEHLARRGVALMPGGRGLFPSLTVAENLRLARWMVAGHAAKRAAHHRSLATFPFLAERLHARTATLSGGEQQMLSMAMALTTEPALLCIDELSLGLAPAIVADLVSRVRGLHAAGTTVVVVEQSVNVALLLADRAVFLERGQVRYEGATRELLDRPDVLRAAFLGTGDSGPAPAVVPGGASAAVPRRREPPRGAFETRGGAQPAANGVDPVEAVSSLGAAAAGLAAAASGGAASGSGGAAAPNGGRNGRDPAGRDPAAGPVLNARDLRKRFGGVLAVDGVSLEVAPGEVVGLIGHNGAGKTSLMDVISGFHTPDEGAILLSGRDVTKLPVHRRSGLGLGRSFQDARLFPALTVAETLTVAQDRYLANRDPLAAALRLPVALASEDAARVRVDELIRLLGLHEYRDRRTAELSTGTRRIVEIGCALAQQPSVLLLDEPSSGVAQRDVEALGPLLRQVRDSTGCSILLVEHDMPLLAAVCDRLVALELGEVIASGTPTEVLAHPRVIASYLGTDERTVARTGAIPVGAPSPGLRPR